MVLGVDRVLVAGLRKAILSFHCCTPAFGRAVAPSAWLVFGPTEVGPFRVRV